MIIVVYSNIIHSTCPSIDTNSHETVNGMGKSSYSDNYMGFFFSNLLIKNKLSLTKPIVIVGAGYGAGTLELLSLGAKEIYLNDLDSGNLICAKQFIDSADSKKSNNIHYLPGNISEANVLKKIPNKSIGFFYAKNVIPLLDFSELVKLIIDANKKMAINGRLIFVFENPILNDQIKIFEKMSSDINKLKNHDNTKEIDTIVKYYYKNEILCSIKDYESTPINIREIGFPCVVHGKDNHFDFLMPSTISGLLKNNGFDVTESIEIKEHAGTFIISAIKKEDIASMRRVT